MSRAEETVEEVERVRYLKWLLTWWFITWAGHELDGWQAVVIAVCVLAVYASDYCNKEDKPCTP